MVSFSAWSVHLEVFFTNIEVFFSTNFMVLLSTKKSNFKVSVDFVSTWNFVHILQFIIKVTLSMVYLIFVSTFLKLNSKLHFLCIF